MESPRSFSGFFRIAQLTNLLLTEQSGRELGNSSITIITNVRICRASCPKHNVNKPTAVPIDPITSSLNNL